MQNNSMQRMKVYYRTLGYGVSEIAEILIKDLYLINIKSLNNNDKYI